MSDITEMTSPSEDWRESLKKLKEIAVKYVIVENVGDQFVGERDKPLKSIEEIFTLRGLDEDAKATMLRSLRKELVYLMDILRYAEKALRNRSDKDFAAYKRDMDDAQIYAKALMKYFRAMQNIPNEVSSRPPRPKPVMPGRRKAFYKTKGYGR